MAKKCAIIPKVRNKNGQNEDSKLFKDLLSFTDYDRKETIRIYQITKSEKFIEKMNPKLVLDERNEPTIHSLLKETNLSTYIPESKVLRQLNKQIGFYKRGLERPALWINNEENFQKLAEKALNFNRNSDFRDDYVAKVIKMADNESSRIFIGVRVEKRDRYNSIEADNMEYNMHLNERLRSILSSFGISIGALSELEQRMGIRGVADFDVAKNSATGLVELIRLAEGIEGEKALPEEFAHFVIEAMGNHPLIIRLVNHLNDNNLVAEILGEEYNTYNNLYGNDKAKMAKEAAGKLLAKHLLKAEPIVSKPYKNLLERVINAIKSFFKSLNATPIQEAIYEADKKFGKLAKDILTGRMNDVISMDNINSDGLYYQTNERVQRDRRLLQNIIANELKRLKIYEKRNPNSQFSERQRLMIDKLEVDLLDNNELEGIYSFISSALEELGKVNNRLNMLNDTSSTSVNEKAAVLRDVRNYLYSYKRIIEDIRENLIEEEKYSDNRYGERIKVVLDNTSLLLGDLFVKYTKTSMPLFVDFIKPFVGEKITIPFGKFQGKSMNPEDLIKIAYEDISFFDRWLDSMADSSDFMLKIIDQAVKKSKEKSRLSTIDVMKELQKAALELEKAGIKNTEWMFERDSNGNLTGYYISEINHALFRENMKKMYKDLNSKYGKNPVGENAKKYIKERTDWFNANMEKVNGKRQPKMSIYANKDFQKFNEAQKKYYTTVMDIKAKLDAYLPEKYTTLTNAVKIRKDLLERVKSSKDIISGSKQVWESIKDEFIARTDDADLGDRAVVKDFEGNEVQSLPIYYIKMKEGESPNDLSTDITSTMTAYAAMANDYNEMGRIINVLELGRDLLRGTSDTSGREVVQTRGNNPMVEKFTMMGRTMESKLIKYGDQTRFMQRLNDFFEMQVYGRYMADEGNISKTNISYAKVANFVNRVTSLNSLALNALSGISNIATGIVMMRIESLAEEFFSAKNVFIADKNYSTSLPEFLAEIGNRVKISKLALWNELFDVLQEYDTDVRNVNFDRKTWFSRMFTTSTLFFMNNAGEHWLQTRTSLALADAYKMKDSSGNTVSLWEAMEVVPIDKDNPKLGAKLQVKQGYIKEDGTEFTKDDIIKFSRRSAAINQRMHGIYNKADRSAVQRLAIGRMGMMFRKWIKPSLNRRFKSSTYNYDLDAWTEGYYRTSFRFLTQLTKDLKDTQLNIGARWNELNTTEKANIKRALIEVGHFLALSMVLGLIDWPDDDDDRNLLISMCEYQARRLYTELGVMIPGLPMVRESFKILKSPAAGVNTIENTLNLVGLLNPYNYEELLGGEEAVLQSGRYKGHNRATRLIFESPLIPMNKTVYRSLHPEEGIPFYKQ